MCVCVCVCVCVASNYTVFLRHVIYICRQMYTNALTGTVPTEFWEPPRIGSVVSGMHFTFHLLGFTITWEFVITPSHPHHPPHSQHTLPHSKTTPLKKKVR